MLQIFILDVVGMPYIQKKKNNNIWSPLPLTAVMHISVVGKKKVV